MRCEVLHFNSRSVLSHFFPHLLFLPLKKGRELLCV